MIPGLTEKDLYAAIGELYMRCELRAGIIRAQSEQIKQLQETKKQEDSDAN